MSVIRLTDAAVAHIKQHMLKTPDAVGFRLSLKQRGCTGWAYVPEVITETFDDDIKLDSQEISVFIEPSAVPYVQGTVVDFVSENLGQEKLVFKNPNVESECGCGESFQVSDDNDE